MARCETAIKIHVGRSQNVPPDPRHHHKHELKHQHHTNGLRPQNHELAVYAHNKQRARHQMHPQNAAKNRMIDRVIEQHIRDEVVIPLRGVHGRVVLHPLPKRNPGQHRHKIRQ